MSNQIFVNPFPSGLSLNQRWEEIAGTIQLFNSAVSAGEPIDWTDVLSGVGYNEINFGGNGVHGNGGALVTTLSGDGTTVTATANNNFAVGQTVRFKGCTTALGLLLNGFSFVIATCSATQFTFASTANDTGTGETGMVVCGRSVRPILKGPLSSLTATVTALSASGTTLTVTAANTFLPGAGVIVSVATGTLGPKLAGIVLKVIQSTGTAFTATMPSALSGSTGTGTATGGNPSQPFEVRFWSSLASGYTYQYNSTFGTLFVQQSAGFTPAGTVAAPTFTGESYTPAGTNSAPTITTTSGGVATALGVAGSALSEVTGASGITGVQAPTFSGTAHTLAGTNSAPAFTGSAVSAGPSTKLAAAAYPAGVLADVIKYSARWSKP